MAELDPDMPYHVPSLVLGYQRGALSCLTALEHNVLSGEVKLFDFIHEVRERIERDEAIPLDELAAFYVSKAAELEKEMLSTPEPKPDTPDGPGPAPGEPAPTPKPDPEPAE